MIDVQSLLVRLGDFTLGPIDLHVDDGEYMVIVGPTGCGKTVLLESLAGISRIDGGRIIFHDEDVTSLPPEKRDAGFVYQRSMLFPHLSVRDNILYGLRYRSLPREARERRLAELAELLGIDYLLDRSVGALSGGESQKVALARALVIEPSVLFFDEPLGPLDQTSKEALRGEIKSLHGRLRTTTLHVTHDRETAVMLADRIGVMSRGALEQVDTVDKLFNRPDNEFVARFLGTENIFPATAENDGSGTWANLDCGAVKSAGTGTGRVAVCLHAEKIAVLPEPTAASEANQVEGIVEEVILEQASVLARVQTSGERFTVRDAVGGKSIPQVGTRVWLAFMPEDVHLARPSE